MAISTWPCRRFDFDGGVTAAGCMTCLGWAVCPWVRRCSWMCWWRVQPRTQRLGVLYLGALYLWEPWGTLPLGYLGVLWRPNLVHSALGYSKPGIQPGNGTHRCALSRGAHGAGYSQVRLVHGVLPEPGTHRCAWSRGTHGPGYSQGRLVHGAAVTPGGRGAHPLAEAASGVARLDSAHDRQRLRLHGKGGDCCGLGERGFGGAGRGAPRPPARPP